MTPLSGMYLFSLDQGICGMDLDDVWCMIMQWWCLNVESKSISPWRLLQNKPHSEKIFRLESFEFESNGEVAVSSQHSFRAHGAEAAWSTFGTVMHRVTQSWWSLYGFTISLYQGGLGILGGLDEKSGPVWSCVIIDASKCIDAS